MPGKVHRRDRDPRYSLARQAGWVGGLVDRDRVFGFIRSSPHTYNRPECEWCSSVYNIHERLVFGPGQFVIAIGFSLLYGRHRIHR